MESKAYCGVISSSKEILKSNKRYLYCNMLQLLAKTTKTTGIIVDANTLTYDDNIQFWLCEILPLIFDETENVQQDAINAIEIALQSFDLDVIHQCALWKTVKSIIIEMYPSKLHTFRNQQNSNWFRIWCILIRILDKDICMGASTINSYLNIVEQGFRSTEPNVRTEAFHCWKFLIEMFAKHNELDSTKRIKLLCIPLKSSKSKTLQTATIRLKVWWYLICKINSKIEAHFEMVIDPFLTFCFGSTNKNCLSISHNSKEITMLCLSAMLMERNHVVEENLQKHEMEILSVCPIINHNIMEKYWLHIGYCVFEVIKIFKEHKEYEENLMRELLKTLMQYALDLNSVSLLEYLLCEVKKLPNDCYEASTVFIDHLSINKTISKQDFNIYKQKLSLFMNFIISQNSKMSTKIMQKVIINIFDINSSKESESEWMALTTVFNVIFQNEEDEDFNSFEIKIVIWITISQKTCEYMRKNHLELRLKEKSDIINHWILWSLKIYSNFQGKKCLHCFDEEFCLTWKNLLDYGHNSHDRENFLQTIAERLTEIIEANKEFVNLSKLFDSYAQACIRTENTEITKHIFNLLEVMLKKPLSIDILEPCLATFKKLTINLNENHLTSFIDKFKNIISLTVKLHSQKTISKAIFDEFKRSIMDKMKTHPNKAYHSQIKEIFKYNDVFVVIPAVWSLNPDKLTERQKEKFHKRPADIPALYNDMSRSQESNSMKPWAPKKIVIDNNEIVIENDQPKNDECLKNDSDEIKMLMPKISPEKIIKKEEKSNDLEQNEMKKITENQQKPEGKKTKSIALSMEDRELLKKWNIETEDERKTRLILKQLRQIEIDTVDGEKYRLGQSSRKKRILGIPFNEMHAQNMQELLTDDIKPLNDASENADQFADKSSIPPSQSVFSKRVRRSAKKSKILSSDIKLETKIRSEEKPGDNFPLAKEINEIDATSTNNEITLGTTNALDPSNVDDIIEIIEIEKYPKNTQKISEQETLDFDLTEAATMDSTILEEQKKVEEDQILSSPKKNKKMSEQETQDVDLTEAAAMDSSISDFAQKTESYQEKTEKISEQETQDFVLTEENVMDSSVNKSSNIAQNLKDKECDATETLLSTSSNIDGERQESKNATNSVIQIGENSLPSEISPKKSTIKLTPLSSPPNRKLTNNSTSPTLKPKPSSTHLTGRGAQFINMIRNKKPEPPASKLSAYENVLQIGKNDNSKHQGQQPSESLALLDTNILPLTENASTPVQNKDFLVFSKRLPSPTASPSASILKRKIRRDSLDDIESPANKRKRVSFLDPPVSITKEYITDNNDKFKPKRCLILDKALGTPNSTKYLLKRKMKIENVSDIEKNSDSFELKTPTTPNNATEKTKSDDDTMSSLKWKSFDSTNEIDTSTSVQKLFSDTDLVFENKESVLNYIANEFSIDDILKKYSNINENSNDKIKISQSLAKYLSKCMIDCSKIKTNVLETFSEKHSKDFLDHAVQENLSSVVCDRLNLNSVIDYICEKSKINANCRNSLLQKISELLSQSKFENDRHNFMIEIMKSINLTDDQIFSIIEMLLKMKRSRNEPSVSESAVDSSSNL